MNLAQKTLIATLIAGSVLHGCGGGGGGSTGAASGTDAGAGKGNAVETLSGKVIDGYIEGATVCMDFNYNDVCDSGEPSAVTGVGGLYSLDISGLDNTNVASAILLVSIPVTAKDADDNGLTFEQAGKAAAAMKAPVNLATPSANIISPLTTIVVERMRAHGVSNAVATEWVRSKLGLAPTGQLNVDFKVDGNEEERAKLAEIATNLFAFQNYGATKCINKLNATFGTTSADYPKAVSDCALEGLEALFLIVNIVGVNGLTAADADKVYQALRFSFDNADATRAGISRYFNSTNTMLGADFPAGLNDFRDIAISADCAADANCPNAGYFRVRSSSFNNGQFKVADYFAIQQPDFVPNPATRTYWQLTNSSWASVESQMLIQVRADGDFSITGGEYGSTGEILGANGFNLAGLGLNTAGLKRFRADQVFPEGSNGYLLSYKTSAERYLLSGAALTGPNQAPLTGSLPDAYPSSAIPTYANALSTRSGMWITFTPTSAGAGTLSFRNPDIPNQVLATGGAYETRIVDGQTMLMITEIPAQVLTALELSNPTATSDYARGIRTFFAVAPDGGLREGVFTPVSIESDLKLKLNRTALNAVLQALSLCQLNASYENTGCPN